MFALDGERVFGILTIEHLFGSGFGICPTHPVRWQ